MWLVFGVIWAREQEPEDESLARAARGGRPHVRELRNFERAPGEGQGRASSPVKAASGKRHPSPMASSPARGPGNENARE
jgi:hypothetical protein